MHTGSWPKHSHAQSMCTPEYCSTNPLGHAGAAATPWMAAARPVGVRVWGAQPGAAELGLLPRDEHQEPLPTPTHLPWTRACQVT